MASILDSRLSVLGPGRAASALARSWLRAGGRLGAVIARTSDGAARAVAQIGGGEPRLVNGSSIAGDLLVLGVPDDAIRSVAQSVSGRVDSPIAFHLSGALPASELSPLAAGGASVGSLHPVRAFSGVPGENWDGVFVAIEGEEEAARVGNLVVEALGAHGHRIDAAGKPLYHAAATLSAGGSVALVSLAVNAWTSLGIPEKEAQRALSNLSAGALAAADSRSFAEVFTGPVARRDVGTVRAHRAALKRLPDALAVYDALARETLARTPGLGKEDIMEAVLRDREI